MSTPYDPQILDLLTTFFGKNYIDFLKFAHDQKQPATYLEIGVNQGRAFSLCNPDCHAVGIEPQAGLFQPQHPRHQLVTLTSDEFFDKAPEKINEQYFNNKPLDLAFVDGMHLFEYALRDILNIEKLCHKSSVILLHDCYPIDQITASRNRKTGFWTGDVWRVIPALKKFRPDLTIKTIPIAPSGICVISNLNPQVKSKPHLNEIVEQFRDYPYVQMNQNKNKVLNVCLDKAFSV